MKNVNILFFLLFLTGAFAQNKEAEQQKVNVTLDAWHQAGATSNFENYFGMMTPDAIFIGTDATENWNKKDFELYAKPFFDKGKGWKLVPLERHIFLDSSGKTAWFDELLNSSTKICRGSGVMVRIGKDWKIEHYVLSLTIPNDNANEVVKIKTPIEDALIKKLQEKL
jgi:hypothetical protein